MVRMGVWIGPIILLLIALLDMPYGYYQLMRVIIFCVSAHIAIHEKDRNSELWFWIFIACAIIYNPIFKLSFGKELWPFVNIVTTALFGYYFWIRSKASLHFRGKI